jgi:hypothetical protein
VATDLVFDKPRVQELNEARLVHLASLGLDLNGKTVLEIGAGIGLLTYFWEERNCKVVSTDGRPENNDENLQRHPWRCGRVFHADLRVPGSHSEFGCFDIVHAYSVLYLLPKERLAPALAELASLTKELFLTSVVVRPADDSLLTDHEDRLGVRDLSLDGRGCRPARDWFLHELKQHFGFAYLTRTQPNDRTFKTHWPAKFQNPRAIFVASKTRLDLPTLSETLLTEQEHYKG